MRSPLQASAAACIGLLLALPACSGGDPGARSARTITIGFVDDVYVADLKDP